MTAYLDVFLQGVRAGRLTQAPGGAVTFSYDDDQAHTHEFKQFPS